MIHYFREILPFIFIFFFLIKGNKEPLYLLGIPFLMFMSNSIFFDEVKIFNQPGSLSYALILIWLIIFWFIARLSRANQWKFENEYKKSLTSLDFCIIGLIIISLIHLGLILRDVSPDILKEFVHLVSLFAGYFIIKDWISRNNPELVIKFLFSLIIVNTVASLLFILHQGLNFKIYPDQELIQEYFQGEDITRSFWFMPQFLFFSIIFILVFKEKYPSLYKPLLIINILAVFITYTRSYVTMVAVIFLLYALLTGLKKGKLGLIFKNILIYGILGIIGLFIISKVLPAKSKYFMSRFSELSDPSSTSDPNNLEFRFMNTSTIISHMDPNRKTFGMGPVTEKQSDWVPQMELATSDMVWTGVIFRWGFAGFILFILLYIFSIIQAFRYYMRHEGLLSFLALFLLIYLISQIMESFVSWTFLSQHGFPTGLWYFAVLSWVLGFKKRSETSFSEFNTPLNFR